MLGALVVACVRGNGRAAEGRDAALEGLWVLRPKMLFLHDHFTEAFRQGLVGGKGGVWGVDTDPTAWEATPGLWWWGVMGADSS